ncbi:DUF3540 domain-containing protein [Winslowiella iniecta]|uniref:Lipoprotein n=1 Tax=Winslowiella iniecta TaxID=1560201 RepID=A0A0L7TAA1_9GAMM|nr:DUF3540 domain-containing protein [Winslowiella iniecta]KOC88891.1 hypothetical protein NG42_14655 [Winslowiella iniecta]KOC92293.1 hypothetical protein NG43_14050 [Winslowiella iniecta]
MNTANQTYPATLLSAQQSTGRVTHLFPDGTLTVECAERGWHCRRAASCLLVPAVGDAVLLVTIEQGVWVLAILDRSSPRQTAELSTESALRIVSQGELSLSSKQFRITAEEADCHIHALKYSGESLSAWVNLTSLVGKRCESVWQTITQISNNVFRKTSQTEHLRAGQLDIKAENYLRMHAQNTVITAKAIAKVDAGQIHMG